MAVWNISSVSDLLGNWTELLMCCREFLWKTQRWWVL